MSWQPAIEPVVERAPCPDLETVIVPRARDIGGFPVRRVLPAAQRRAVGPFVFLDQMGPTSYPAGAGLDVRPHPHIGLATLTYLFAGEIMHRDSLGSVQAIRPGACNWMTAGRGIVHSERTPEGLRADGGVLFGLQAWVALPREDEDAEPSFAHHAESELPELARGGARLRLVAGTLLGMRSPVQTHSPLFYAEALLEPGARLALPGEHAERAIYVVEGAIELAGERFESERLLVFRGGGDVPLAAAGAARLMLLGGAPLDGPRHIWWNFVASARPKIAEAKARWRAQAFAPVPGESEFVPLPE
jgi:redox-sensitive bicupin YhaK (pirin superfamily)